MYIVDICKNMNKVKIYNCLLKLMFWLVMCNKFVFGCLIVNICILSEKGLVLLEIFRGFEFDFVDLLWFESVEVILIYKVLN